jgi:hypothetical protein
MPERADVLDAQDRLERVYNDIVVPLTQEELGANNRPRCQHCGEPAVRQVEVIQGTTFPFCMSDDCLFQFIRNRNVQ